PRGPPVWLIAALAGAICVATRALPWHDTVATTERVGPILMFLVAITVVAERADAAQVFDVAATRAAKMGRGRTLGLFGLVLLLGSLTTIVLSLDTTAVLLTPVVLALATNLRLSVVPFAMAAVWLANTASLLLPVSNLTNLLAVNRLHLPPLSFAARMWLPALASIAVTAIVLGVAYRRDLRGRYSIPSTLVVDDPIAFRICATVCIGIAPFFVTGLPVWLTATIAAAVMIVVFAVRQPRRLQISLLPWRLVFLVQGLFLVVATLGAHGLDRLLGNAAGQSDNAIGMLRTAGVGAGASNIANNLPTYIAMERISDGRRHQLLSVLLGTNVGPLIVIWGSLATLLWRERCKARDVDISVWQFARIGLVGVPLLLVASWGALLVTG
ncbi:MAG: arsenical pump rane protein, partial [Actinomycetota bacterium]|nr:arsenical pump rane protein [Actinomycetota bacterium]